MHGQTVDLEEPEGGFPDASALGFADMALAVETIAAAKAMPTPGPAAEAASAATARKSPSAAMLPAFSKQVACRSREVFGESARVRTHVRTHVYDINHFAKIALRSALWS